MLVAVRKYVANNLLGLVALFVALGGTSYAAVVLKKPIASRRSTLRSRRLRAVTLPMELLQVAK